MKENCRRVGAGRGYENAMEAAVERLRGTNGLDTRNRTINAYLLNVTHSRKIGPILPVTFIFSRTRIHRPTKAFLHFISPSFGIVLVNVFPAIRSL